MPTEIDSVKIDVVLQDVAGEEKKFTTFKSLSQFVEGEFSFWRETFGDASRHNPMNQLLSISNTAHQEVANYRNSFSSWDENTRQGQLGPFLNRVKTHFLQLAFSKTPLAIAFIEACELGYQQANGFWAFVANYNNGQLLDNRADTFEGALLGYEFIHQSESAISKRRTSEKRALSTLRKTLSDKTDELIGETDDFRRDIDEWKTTSQEELAADRKAYKNEQEKFLLTSAEKLETQLTKNKEDRDQYFANASRRLADLETLYQEKLRLEPAATYWKDRAKSLMWAGRCYGAVMALITIAIGCGFGWLFFQWMTKGEVIKVLRAEHWQGVIMLGATVTMAIFMIRVLGKLTFSAFHLQRDAEEKEQLSYLYLALSQDGNVDNESRQVVLQSLFSRAETGLLSGDHGPTIPAAEVVQKLRSS